jgi:N-acetylneuraminic acid mutarotase
MEKKNIAIIFLALLVSCENIREYEYPLIQTGDITDIDSTGAVFNAKIADLGKEKVDEYGFVWDTKQEPDILRSEKYKISTLPKTGAVKEHISTTLKNGVKYYVRAFIKSNNYLTYGKEVSFTSSGSEAAVIDDFEPKVGNLGDTVLIFGKNFSYILSNNIVQFNQFKASVISATQDTLMIIVPQGLNSKSSIISVSIQGKEALSDSEYNLITLELSDFQAKTASFRSRINLSGKNFNSNPQSLHVYFDKFEAAIVELSDQNLIVTVPDSLDKKSCMIRVKMNNITNSFSEYFNLKTVTLTDFTPKVAVTGATISLTGQDFSPVIKNNKVTIGGLNSTVTYASTSELKVTLPKQDIGYYQDRNSEIIVEVLGDNIKYSEKLLINDKWFRLKNSPISKIAPPDYASNYALTNCFVSNGKAYIGMNNRSEFWEFNPYNGGWKRLSDFPGLHRWYGTGFAIENKIYYGTGSSDQKDLNDWWVYDIGSDSWSAKTSFPGTARTGAVAFSIGNSGYLGTGFDWGFNSSLRGYNDFWKYNPADDSWIRISDYPMMDYWGIWWGVGIANEQDAFIGLGSTIVSGNYSQRIFKYSPLTDTWKRISNYPFPGGNVPLSFILDGKTYIKTGATKDFYFYNDNLDTWSLLQTDILSDYFGGISFSSGGKAYVGLGQTNSMWEYDPSK